MFPSKTTFEYFNGRQFQAQYHKWPHGVGCNRTGSGFKIIYFFTAFNVDNYVGILGPHGKENNKSQVVGFQG